MNQTFNPRYEGYGLASLEYIPGICAEQRSQYLTIRTMFDIKCSFIYSKITKILKICVKTKSQPKTVIDEKRDAAIKT